MRVATIALVLALGSVGLAVSAGAAPADPGEPVLVSAETGSTRSLRDYAVTADGSTVVMEVSAGGAIQLAMRSLAGGPLVEVTDHGADGVGPWRLSPDGERVVYGLTTGDGTNAGTFMEVWVAPVGSGAPVRLADEVPGSVRLKRVIDVRLTDDGEWVIFVGRGEGSSRNELYSVPADGSGAAFRLDDPSDGDVQAIWQAPTVRETMTPHLAPDGTVVYVANTGGHATLYAVDPDGGNRRLLARGQRSQLTPDGSRVVYGRHIGRALHWYSIPLAGGPEVRLTQDFVPGGTVSKVAVSPDSSTLVFVADADTNNQRELYSVPIAGGAVTKLNATLPTGGDVAGRNDSDDPGFLISPDSTQVVYVADQRVDNRRELWSVPIHGGTPVRLNEPLVRGGDVKQYFAITPDSRQVLYRADQRINNRRELFVVPIDGGDVRRLSGRLISTGDVARFVPTPDSGHVIYRADKDVNGTWELYTVSLTGTRRAKLNQPLAANRDVYREFTVTETAVLFSTDAVVNQRYQLYRVDRG